ncbi:hypothetical protein T492DRAFT_509001 [Pavlovales sp. CCMP2436]|nr:hypothetical protein T492DRAFT_509001 [Pavlovales sp. CCMP2436]
MYTSTTSTSTPNSSRQVLFLLALLLKCPQHIPPPHAQAISLLVPLSPPGAFSGGGTAFWTNGHHGPRPTEGQPSYEPADARSWLPHDLLLNPARGTAIIFGGDVTHSGLHVIAGTRHIFVMSFSLKPRGCLLAPAAASLPMESEKDSENPIPPAAIALGDYYARSSRY